MQLLEPVNKQWTLNVMNDFLMWTCSDSFNMTKTMTGTECSDRYYYPKPSSYKWARDKLMKKSILLHYDLIWDPNFFGNGSTT